LNGCDVYLGKYRTEESRAEYDRIIAEWLSSGRNLPVRNDDSHELTVNELLLAYLRFAEGYYTKNGKRTSEYACMKAAVNPLQILYGRTPATAFGPLRLKVVTGGGISGDRARVRARAAAPGRFDTPGE
jgi:hypothetical protein